MKKLLYIIFVRNKFVSFLSSNALSIVIPPIVALYYGTLDIWGDDWDIVKNHKQIHGFVFTSMAAITFIVLFVKGVSETLKGMVAKKYELLMESLVVFFNDLVKKKKDRFYQKAKNLGTRKDVFKHITQPRDQLEHVLDGTKKFLVEGLEVDQKSIGITIIQGDLSQKKWWYALKCDSQKQHTKAKTHISHGHLLLHFYFESLTKS